MKTRFPKKEKEFSEKVIKINRVTRVVKGGRRLRFRATVVAGDHRGRVGMGVAKANEVSDAVTKAATKAKASLITVPIVNNTIPHVILAKFGSAKVLLKPATEGTGVIAGGAVRDILDLAGIKNVVGKMIGSRNKLNSSHATLEALKLLRTKEAIFIGRGREIKSATPKDTTVKTETAVKKEEPKKTTKKPSAKPASPKKS